MRIGICTTVDPDCVTWLHRRGLEGGLQLPGIGQTACPPLRCVGSDMELAGTGGKGDEGDDRQEAYAPLEHTHDLLPCGRS